MERFLPQSLQKWAQLPKIWLQHPVPLNTVINHPTTDMCTQGSRPDSRVSSHHEPVLLDSYLGPQWGGSLTPHQLRSKTELRNPDRLTLYIWTLSIFVLASIVTFSTNLSSLSFVYAFNRWFFHVCGYYVPNSSQIIWIFIWHWQLQFSLFLLCKLYYCLEYLQ